MAALLLWVDEEENVWAQVDRRRFLVAGAGLALGGVGTRAGEAAGSAASAGPSVLPVDDPFQFASTVTSAWPGLRLSRPIPPYGVDWTVLFPGGRAMAGGEAAVQLHPARGDRGRIVMEVPNSTRVGEFARRPARGYLVGAGRFGDRHRFFLLDTRAARQWVGRGPAGRGLPVPAAYELDDLTYGLLWASTNFDDALQADDGTLTETLTDLKVYERLSASAVSREAAPGLNPVAHMWLGSDFCARHILGGLPGLPEPPSFWTREQRGEEASAWLLFDHKYRYLRETALTLGSSTSRAFCIPEAAVDGSPRFERILLFLAAALMESLRIRVKVTDDPSYADIEGFVVAPRKQAIIANWVRGDGLWHVDTTVRAPIIREFTDVVSTVGTHSIVEGPTARDRLHAFADYLGLDWPWLLHRCGELTRHGTAGLVGLRSGRLSTAGLDAACAFLGTLPPDQ